MSDDRLADAETVFEQLQGPKQAALDTAFRTLQSKSQLGCVAIAEHISRLLCPVHDMAAAPCPALLSGLGAHPAVGPLAQAHAALSSYVDRAGETAPRSASELRHCDVLWRACGDVCAMASLRFCEASPTDLPDAVRDMLPYLPANVMLPFLQLCAGLTERCVFPAASSAWIASGVQLPHILLPRWPAPPVDVAAGLWDTVVAPRLAVPCGPGASRHARAAERAAWRMTPLLCSVVPQHMAALDLPAILRRTGCALAWARPPGVDWRSAGLQLSEWLQGRASTLQQECLLIQHAPLALLQCPALVRAAFAGSARHTWAALVAAVSRSAAAQDPTLAGHSSVYVWCVPSEYLNSAGTHSPAVYIARVCALVSILCASQWVLAVHALQQLQHELQLHQQGHSAEHADAGLAWCCALASSHVWLEPALLASQAEHGAPQPATAASACAELVQWLLEPFSVRL